MLDSSGWVAIWYDRVYQPTDPSSHPPTYTPNHGGGSLHSSQIFKENGIIMISSRLITLFWWFGTTCVWRVAGCCSMHGCIHIDMWWNHGYSPGTLQWGQLFAIKIMLNIHVHVCMCIHACACAWDTPPTHTLTDPPTCHPDLGASKSVKMQ